MKIPNDMICGSIFKNRLGHEFKVIKYEGYIKVTVMFTRTGTVKIVTSANIRKGAVKDPNEPAVYGIGFIGDGDFSAKTIKHGLVAYNYWFNMLKRCYSGGYRTYKECYVCNEWHNFQNFAKWFYENHPKDGNRYEIDKDIKVDGNRVYSPLTCIFTSRRENSIKANCVKSTFISPLGEEVEIYNISEFCRNNGLHDGHMSSVRTGKLKSHAGWTIKK